MKSNKASDLKKLSRRRRGDEQNCTQICIDVFTSHTPPDQLITSVVVPLPKKGDLSLVTNYITLTSITVKVYNRILLSRIRDHVDPILRKNQAGFRPGSKLCTADSHPMKDH